MNDQQFDEKLRAELRQVAVPADLHAQLLELSRSPTEQALLNRRPISAAVELSGRRKTRRRTWGIAAMAAGAAVSIWLGWSLLEQRRATELANQSRAEVIAGTSDEEQPQVDALAELEQMRRELGELQQAYIALEQEELAIRIASQGAEPEIGLPPPSHDWRQAEAIYWTAETSLFSGLKTNSVREQLEYLVDEFPGSIAAERAATLLADF